MIASIKMNSVLSAPSLWSISFAGRREIDLEYIDFSEDITGENHLDSLSIEATPYTPLIQFNAEKGEMRIEGRVIPEDTEKFWDPILDWFESYLQSPNQITEFHLDLDYFNIASARRILLLLYKLKELYGEGRSIKVNWYYTNNDEDMFEAGQDMAYTADMYFKFIEKDEFSNIEMKNIKRAIC